MPLVIDLTGQTFGRWKVIKRVENYKSPKGNVNTQWLCECSCEKHTQRIVNGKNLRRGLSKSCGCYNVEKCVERSRKPINRYTDCGEYMKGHDEKGRSFLISKEDYEKVHCKHWYISNNGYWTNGERSRELLHRFIMKPQHGQVVDHINRNTNDNRRENLRICAQAQNTINQKLKSNNTSGVCGVSWDKHAKKWEAHIRVNKKKKFLGYFDKLDDARKVRAEAEDIYYGEFINQEKRNEAGFNGTLP